MLERARSLMPRYHALPRKGVQMKRTALAIATLLAIALIQTIEVSSEPVVERGPIAKMLSRTAHGQPQLLPNGRLVPMLSSGREQAVTQSLGLGVAQATTAAPKGGFTLPTISTYGCPNVFKRGGFPDNVRVNQDCGFRQQAEEWVAVNPTDPSNIVASSNDSKYSGNRTGVEFSLDGGKHWGDSELPVGRLAADFIPGGEWSFDAIDGSRSCMGRGRQPVLQRGRVRRLPGLQRRAGRVEGEFVPEGLGAAHAGRRQLRAGVRGTASAPPASRRATTSPIHSPSLMTRT